MLCYQDELPLRWIAGEVSLGDRERRNSNSYVLEVVAAVEEHPLERGTDEQQDLFQELARLDAKLQLLMEMVARLLQERDDVPGKRVVRIGVERVDIAPGDSSMAAGTEGLLRLYLHPAIPTPLLLPGRLLGEVEEDGGRWLRFEPFPLSEGESEALSRHVFRHHRRSIAASRLHGGSG